MKNITVGIIGGTNGMGRWLADLLKGRLHRSCHRQKDKNDGSGCRWNL